MHFPNLRSHGVEPYDLIEHCPLLMSVALEAIQLDRKSSSQRCAHPDCSRITGKPEVIPGQKSPCGKPHQMGTDKRACIYCSDQLPGGQLYDVFSSETRVMRKRRLTV